MRRGLFDAGSNDAQVFPATLFKLECCGKSFVITKSIADCATALRLKDGQTQTVNRAQCQFCYRNPSAVEGNADFLTLPNLDEPNILHSLRSVYRGRLLRLSLNGSCICRSGALTRHSAGFGIGRVLSTHTQDRFLSLSIHGDRSVPPHRLEQIFASLCMEAVIRAGELLCR